MAPRPVQHRGGVELDPCLRRFEPPSVHRVRTGCGRGLLPAKLGIVVHYLPHQVLNHFLADEPVLLTCQFCDRLRDCVDDFIRFSGVDSCLSLLSRDFRQRYRRSARPSCSGGRVVPGLLLFLTLIGPQRLGLIGPGGGAGGRGGRGGGGLGLGLGI
jgi:hypothetical protein